MATLTLPLICTCDGQLRSYYAHKRNLGHHTHHSPTCTQRPTGDLSEDDAYGGAGHCGALPRSVPAGVAKLRA